MKARPASPEPVRGADAPLSQYFTRESLSGSPAARFRLARRSTRWSRYAISVIFMLDIQVIAVGPNLFSSMA